MGGRIIDVSRAAAEQLDFVNAGVAQVSITARGRPWPRLSLIGFHRRSARGESRSSFQRR
jgi:rare lipoprotein A (peptidoglycan hydrolase)